MTKFLSTLWVVSALVATPYLMFHAAAAIDTWERVNGYPYGHLCNLYSSCGMYDASEHVGHSH
jgi:hypothetical protein